MVEDKRYFFDDAETAREGARLRLIEEAYDPTTHALLERLGVEAGWRCAEIGAGAGSIAAWLGERVGPTGRVVAIDRDVRHLGWIDAPNISVRACDIVADNFERGQFDLVHFRGLLEHVRDVDRALQQMADSLAPGGWLLGEGGDFGRYQAVDKSHPLAATFDQAMSKTFSFIQSAGIFDPYVVSSLASVLATVGLVDIAVADESIIYGGSPQAIMFETSWEAFDAVLSANGVMTGQEVAVRSAAHRDSTFAFTAGAVYAWGRHP